MDVEIRDIHKRFGAVRANAGISLRVTAGTIQGVLGENGAGKSTLMKILSGFQPADRGEILLDGRMAHIGSPADAIRAGVGMLHQDPMDFPAFRVIDDFLVGRPGGISLSPGQARRELQAQAEHFGFSLEPNREIARMTVGERQQLELLRLLWQGAGVLILDEPTTGISAPQRETLFAILRQLAAEKKTVLFVSHKLDEVERLCHRVAVLRQGRLVGEESAPFDTAQLVRLMFGKEIVVSAPRSTAREETVLTLEGIEVEDARLHVGPTSLEVRAGEVLGLAGMEGSGQSLLLRVCAGLMSPVAGRLLLDGHDMTHRPYRSFHDRGVAYVPAARLEQGLVPGLSLTEHVLLSERHRGPLIDWKRGRAKTARRIHDFNIRGEPDNTVESLSGGNQQRALLALVPDPARLLLLEHPTRGLDVESTVYIWSKLKQRCTQGTAIVFVSSELEELLRYGDRVAVLFSGRVSAPVSAALTSVEELGELIGGKGLEPAA
ncbi:MAG: ATP-binding cassette domain-containing protein [Gaiellales bacterium]|nr:ATP-binding cassette domain-containing protein [Gaiellales bacterium]